MHGKDWVWHAVKLGLGPAAACSSMCSTQQNTDERDGKAHHQVFEALGRVVFGLAGWLEPARLQGLPVQGVKPAVPAHVLHPPRAHAQPLGGLALQQPGHQVLHPRSSNQQALLWKSSGFGPLQSHIVGERQPSQGPCASGTHTATCRSEVARTRTLASIGRHRRQALKAREQGTFAAADKYGGYLMVHCSFTMRRITTMGSSCTREQGLVSRHRSAVLAKSLGVRSSWCIRSAGSDMLQSLYICRDKI